VERGVDHAALSPRQAFGSTRRRAAALSSAAVAGVVVLLATVFSSTAAARVVAAHEASTITLNETAHLHLTSHHGFTLNEEGSVSGTITGTIYIHLNVVSTNRVTAEVNIYPRGSSITGSASAAYHPSGGVASFDGTMSVKRGTGRYAHAYASGLTFTGTVQRSNDAVTVHVGGRMST
jgi:hypothetical protein